MGGMACDNEYLDYQVPEFCPRCGEKTHPKPDGTINCPACGILYYDMWLGVWRILRTEIEED